MQIEATVGDLNYHGNENYTHDIPLCATKVGKIDGSIVGLGKLSSPLQMSRQNSMASYMYL